MNISESQQEFLNRGKKCFEQGDLAGAKALLGELIETDGKNDEAFFLLGNVFHLEGAIPKAIKAFKKTLALNPNHTDAAVSLSVLYNDIGQYDEAQRIFTQANDRVKMNESSMTTGDTHINKKFSAKHIDLADLYMSYERFDEALFEYQKAIGLDPANLEVRLQVAKVYAKKGFIEKAFEELKKVKRERPEYLPARISLGVLYYAQGNIIEAESEWQRVLVYDPASKDAKKYLELSQSATETRLN